MSQPTETTKAVCADCKRPTLKPLESTRHFTRGRWYIIKSLYCTVCGAISQVAERENKHDS